MFGAGAIIALVNSIVSGVSQYFNNKSAEEQARLAIEKAVVEFMRQVDAGQIELNKEEAKSASLFVAGWRPFIGWMGGVAMGYNFLVRPLVDAVTWMIDPAIPSLPAADLNEIIGLVSAMLGVAGLRTYEKVRGIK